MSLHALSPTGLSGHPQRALPLQSLLQRMPPRMSKTLSLSLLRRWRPSLRPQRSLCRRQIPPPRRHLSLHQAPCHSQPSCFRRRRRRRRPSCCTSRPASRQMTCYGRCAARRCAAATRTCCSCGCGLGIHIWCHVDMFSAGASLAGLLSSNINAAVQRACGCSVSMCYLRPLHRVPMVPINT